MSKQFGAWLGMTLLAVCFVGCGARVRVKPAYVVPPSLVSPTDANQFGYGVYWSTDLAVPTRHALSHFEILGDVLVSVESPTNVVTATSLRDGSLVWRRVVGKPAEKLFAPTLSGDRILLNSEKLLYSLAVDSGKLIGVSHLETLVDHAPAVVGDIAVFGGLNHRVFAHDVKAGYTKWAYQMSERVFARPASFGDNVFVADGKGVYAMFDAWSGQLQWKGRTFAKVSARPAMGHLGAFVAGEDHSLYGLHGVTGRDRWVYHTTEPLTISPAYLGNMVFLPIPSGGLIAINARTGYEKWKLDFTADPVMYHEDSLLVFTPTALKRIDLEAGEVVSELMTQELRAVLLGPDRQLILVSPSGRLLMLYPLS